MKREEILAQCASNPEVIAYIISLESQIKDLTERLTALESRLNQNSRNSSKPPSSDYFSKVKPNPKSCVNRVVRNLEVKKVIQEQLLKWLIILIR